MLDKVGKTYRAGRLRQSQIAKNRLICPGVSPFSPQPTKNSCVRALNHEMAAITNLICCQWGNFQAAAVLPRPKAMTRNLAAHVSATHLPIADQSFFTQLDYAGVCARSAGERGSHPQCAHGGECLGDFASFRNLHSFETESRTL